jgi:hypothetical protein
MSAILRYRRRHDHLDRIRKAAASAGRGGREHFYQVGVGLGFLATVRRDGRYALHGETYPPPREDDGFAVYGRAREIDDSATHAGEVFPQGSTVWRASRGFRP